MINLLKQSVRGLTKNKSRTILTTLGIVIGIATVIIVFSAGDGFKRYINAQVDAFGTNFLTIQTRVPKTTKDRNSNSGGGANNGSIAITTLKNKDVEDIKKLPNISNAYGAVIGQKVVTYGNIRKSTLVFGSNASRFEIDKGVIQAGRVYTETEDAALDQVALLGCDIAKDFFGNNDPIGKTVRVGEYNFNVIGVYACRGSFGFSNDDQQVFIPLKTAQKKLLGIDHLFYVVGQMKDTAKADLTVLDVQDVLRENHSIADPLKDDFEVQTQADGLKTFDTILNAVTYFLIAVAGISLVVGGVGIMNIMYVVVTERIPEIGLKKAVGARNSDILNEFLTESIMLTLFGGLLGIAFGSLISFGISVVAKSLGFDWGFSISMFSIMLGLGVSGSVGLVFGVLPAVKASKLDPIEALRQE